MLPYYYEWYGGMAENPRKVRAFAIMAQSGTIRQVEAHTFKVRSQSGNGEYVVTNGHGKYECSCPDFKNRVTKGTVDSCKHVLAVKFYLSLKHRLDTQDIFEVYRDVVEVVECKFCGSISLVRKGKRQTRIGEKPQYLCKTCGKWFVWSEGLDKARYDSKIVALALDLYFTGLSLRKIVRHLKQFYGLEITHVTIYGWIQRYMKIVAEYLVRFQPMTSGVLHVDEMKVKVGGEWVWLWNALDNQTRYLVSNHITQGREIKDARAILAKAKTVTGNNPSILVTDGMQSYNEAYKKEYWTLRNPRTVHLRKVGFKGMITNNRVERLHGTVREREKVMRGMKKQGTAMLLMEAHRIWYNYIRPHQALNGRTPAEVAEIPIELGRNRWLNLLRKALRTKVTTT